MIIFHPFVVVVTQCNHEGLTRLITVLLIMPLKWTTTKNAIAKNDFFSSKGNILCYLLIYWLTLHIRCLSQDIKDLQIYLFSLASCIEWIEIYSYIVRKVSASNLTAFVLICNYINGKLLCFSHKWVWALIATPVILCVSI